MPPAPAPGSTNGQPTLSATASLATTSPNSKMLLPSPCRWATPQPPCSSRTIGKSLLQTRLTLTGASCHLAERAEFFTATLVFFLTDQAAHQFSTGPARNSHLLPNNLQ